MRIVGGDLRGRTLYPVPGRSTRPTADRVRQSLFDRLGQRCDGLRVLDLYAGTGALAFEALSRGASHATLVESDAKAAQVIERNAAELGCTDRCTLLREDVQRLLRQPRQLHGPFDLVFSDPPYALRAAQPTLDALGAAGFDLEDDRRYGDTLVLVARRR
jgi:16S rRNA (guanine966-N2)-methyltransferase